MFRNGKWMEWPDGKIFAFKLTLIYSVFLVIPFGSVIFLSLFFIIEGKNSIKVHPPPLHLLPSIKAHPRDHVNPTSAAHVSRLT